MATYTVAAKDLEGAIFCFQPHHDTSLPFIHQTFNAAYSVHLYETDFHFIFDDVPKNGLTELYKDTPKQLLNHMITHIKMESGSTGTRSKKDKVEKFRQLSYKLGNVTSVYFKRGQELALAIQYFLKTLRPDVPSKCMEIQFTTSRIY